MAATRTVLRKVFVHPRERRLRAGWRLVLQLVLLGLLVAGLTRLVAGFGTLSGHLDAPSPAMEATYEWAEKLAGIVAAVVAVVVAARWLDRRTLANLGLRFDRAWWSQLGAGCALGTAVIGLVFAVAWVAGWVRVSGSDAAGDPWRFTGIVLPVALVVLLDAFSEELIFRAYQLRNLTEGFAGGRFTRFRAIATAITLSSLLFGLAHWSSPNATFISVVTTAGIGAFFALGYAVTGQAGLCTGLHFAWNFAMGRVFGFPVTGHTPTTCLIRIELTGPPTWTGGAYGPEGGLLGWLALAVGIAVLAVGARRLGQGLAPLDRPELRWRPAEQDPS